MTVGVIVEEPSAVAFVNKIAEKLGIRIETRVARGRDRLKTKLEAYAGLLSDCEKIIALVDSHCSNPLEVERDFGTVSNVNVCVIVHAIESWLLADEDAISRSLRTRIRTPPNPESFCKPEEELDKLFERHGKRYIKGRAAKEIAEFIELETVASKCPSFEKFRTSLLHC